MTGSVGMIGAGRLGQAMARTALRAGRGVVMANSRGPESLASVVSELGDGVSAGTVEQASAAGIVVMAVPWGSVPDAVQDIDWDGKIVIDATNDWAADDLNGRTSSELVADLVAGARVVKAANTLEAEVFGADPHEAGGRRVIFVKRAGSSCSICRDARAWQRWTEPTRDERPRTRQGGHQLARRKVHRAGGAFVHRLH